MVLGLKVAMFNEFGKLVELIHWDAQSMNKTPAVKLLAAVGNLRFGVITRHQYLVNAKADLLARR